MKLAFPLSWQKDPKHNLAYFLNEENEAESGSLSRADLVVFAVVARRRGILKQRPRQYKPAP